MNYSEAYEYGKRVLNAAAIPEAALDARLLLEFLTGYDRTVLLAHPKTDVPDPVIGKYEVLLEKRAAHIPLGQITGNCDFMGIVFSVNDKVLIPRQDSECLVEEAMRHVQDGSDILDLCTGSGCLLLSLMHYKNGCRGIGVDISEDALEVANRNLAALEETGGLNGGSARFIAGDMFDALEGINRKFDVIISNPPYIRSDVIPTLMPEVRDHEPRIALDGGADGLTFYRMIAEYASRYLTRGGRIFLEIGFDQAADVTRIFTAAGFTDIEVVKDYGGNDRVVYLMN